MAASHSCERPMVQMKTEELFMRWLTEEATIEVLRLNLQQLLQGESMSTMLSVESAFTPTAASPRPQTPPHSGGMASRSPRSPRRPIKSGSVSPRKSLSRQSASKAAAAAATDESNANNSSAVAANMQQGEIPRFYFPNGAPTNAGPSAILSHANNSSSTSSQTLAIADALRRQLDSLLNGVANWQHMPLIADTMRLPRYWKRPLFDYALTFSAGGGVASISNNNNNNNSTKSQQGVTIDQLLSVLKQLANKDEAAQFVLLLTKGDRGRWYLVQDDFISLVQDIVDSHPGLSFLQEAPEFHGRYVSTVIARIFYDVNASWSGRINCHELRRSRLLSTIVALQHKEDINEITDFFSYEHFYVIYCKFWDIDTDHDLVISKEDLRRHNNYALSDRIIDRIFSGAVSRTAGQTAEGRMTYSEFVWFLLAEEDKRHPRSIEYWFRCMDLDGDGVLSLYELEHFYSEQMRRMEEARIEEYQGLQDCICTMLDMVKPKHQHYIQLSDLKRCKMSHLFFDTMFNLHKYLDYEQRDPFANLRDIQEGNTVSDWDKYATEMYEILVAEESSAAMAEDAYPDDFDDEEDQLQQQLNNENAIYGGSAAVDVGGSLKYLESFKGSKEI